MKILFKFPTRARPAKFRQTLDKYRKMLSGKHECEFRISCDVDDRTMNNPSTISWLRSLPNVKLYIGRNKSKVEAINANMDNAIFSILVLCSDDMIVQVQGYDDIIANRMTETFPHFDGALHFNDGLAGEKLNTLVIMGEKLYRKFGYIYHPQYKSLWCDNEFTDVTRNSEKAKYFSDIIIKHSWTDYTGKDQLHKKNESFYGSDGDIYNKRKAAGFPQGNV